MGATHQCLALCRKERERGESRHRGSSCRDRVRDASSQPGTSQAYAEVAGRIRRGAPARVSSHIGVRPGLQLRRQARRVRGCWRDPESGMEAGRTAAPVPIDPDPGGDDQGVEQCPRLLPESRGLRFLSRRGVLLQPVSHGVRARRRRHQRPVVLPRHRPCPTAARPQCLWRTRPFAFIPRRRSPVGELGQDVHAAPGRSELSGTLRRCGSVYGRESLRGVRRRACGHPERVGQQVLAKREPWHRGR